MTFLRTVQARCVKRVTFHSIALFSIKHKTLSAAWAVTGLPLLSGKIIEKSSQLLTIRFLLYLMLQAAAGARPPHAAPPRAERISYSAERLSQGNASSCRD